MPIAALLRAMRPHQWVKNVFVLAAMVFGRAAGIQPAAYEDVWSTALAFLGFCFGASAIYLFNDIHDVEQDRAHPKKKLRPIASGALPIPVAYVAATASMGLALGLGWFSGQIGQSTLGVAGILVGYIVMNFAYSMRLKHVVLLDAFCIASGFVLRVLAGGVAAQVHVSRWMLLCTLFLALFLALCKRKAEMQLLGEDRGDHRAILREYTDTFLDQMITVMAACTILGYALYTISEDTVQRFKGELVWTVPFVVFGIGRYLLLVQTGKAGGSPTRVLLGGDKLFVFNVLAWMGVLAWFVF